MDGEIILDKSQRRVFDYMETHGSITSLEAISELGETRLSARIYELKDKGVNISYEWMQVLNRYQEKRRVKKYFLG